MRNSRRADHASLLSILLISSSLLGTLAACGDDGSPEDQPEHQPEDHEHQAQAHRANSARRQQLTGSPSRSFVPGELILRTKLEVIAGQVTSFGGVAVTPAEQLPSGTWRVLLEDPVSKPARLARESRLPISDAALASAELATLEAIATIAAAADVQSAYVNGLAELSGERTLGAAPAAAPLTIDPTLEPFYPYQRWNYEAIRLPQAWQRVPQSSWVRLAIIDSESGINLHPDLAAQWVDAASMGPSYHPYHHGAHVAGIAGAAAGNGYGVGVCWQCKLAPYQMDLSFSQIERAINYAVGSAGGPRRVDAMNLSLNLLDRPEYAGQRLSCTDHPEAEGIRLAIARATSRGVAVIISAGNHSVTGPAFPANCPDVISVAATQPNGTIAEYSNRGAGVTLAAPGGGGRTSDHSMYGAWLAEMPCTAPLGGDPFAGTIGVVAPFSSYLDPVPSDKHCYRYLSGTSMAAPHVTGTIGLMRTMHGGLTPAQLRDILVRTARPNTACPAGPCGAGLLNADAAVRYASDGGVPLGTLADHHFGAVDVGLQALGAARITNTGSAPLLISNQLTIAGSNGQIEFAFTDGTCSSGQICNRPSFAVQPGQTFDLPIRCRPTAPGPITATLLFHTNRLDETTGQPDVTLASQLTCTARKPQSRDDSN